LRGCKAREQQKQEAAFAVEARLHRERHQAAPQSCRAKWGSQNSTVVQGTAFCGWRDIVEKAAQPRKYAVKGLNPELQ